ncbi:helicase HerA-like domain-containing protein [Vaginisenegalia massiliensis]|uniref:helicase HerA-like domain-containing protein n=1 Tax=Vaginisenegalia massiliensis TaxID=2058294 RepID=UPI000F527388|nr:helicase HerA-like domain-containing protein [Vaginisenegalia massiliensis]
MSEVSAIQFGYGQGAASLYLNKLNRHGIIAGATGTGKTVTLKVIAEQLSQAGVPVFLSDIKGDLMSLCQEGSTEGLADRLTQTHYETYQPMAFPIQVWDVLAKEGTPLRMTVSEMGPILLTRLLGLNDVQESILNIVFKVADEKGLLLIDLMDLRAMLNYVADHAKELSDYYGNISAQSIGAILRSMVVLEEQGGSIFFGEPSLAIEDFIKTASDGRGVINILNAKEIYMKPTLYATVLLTVLAELFETLPEVGDLDKPKMVFFFDEAHTLFKDTPKALLDKIELIVRLIRSKGVGVFFVTQNPTDIPDTVASQLGNRIQHGLRAFTPKEIKVVDAVAQTFRQAEGQDLAKVIQELKVGQAVVSTLQEDGTPSLADQVFIYPPMSKMGTVDPSVLLAQLNASPLLEKYGEPVNRESAHEQIAAMTQADQEQMMKQAEQAEKQTTRADSTSDQAEDKSIIEEIGGSILKSTRRSSRSDTAMERFQKNLMSSVGREVGRVISRGILGMFKK